MNVQWPTCNTVDLNSLMGTAEELPVVTQAVIPIPSVSSTDVGTSTMQIKKPLKTTATNRRKDVLASL